MKGAVFCKLILEKTRFNNHNRHGIRRIPGRCACPAADGDLRSVADGRINESLLLINILLNLGIGLGYIVHK